LPLILRLFSLLIIIFAIIDRADIDYTFHFRYFSAAFITLAIIADYFRFHWLSIIILYAFIIRYFHCFDAFVAFSPLFQPAAILRHYAAAAFRFSFSMIAWFAISLRFHFRHFRFRHYCIAISYAAIIDWCRLLFSSIRHFVIFDYYLRHYAIIFITIAIIAAFISLLCHYFRLLMLIHATFRHIVWHFLSPIIDDIIRHFAISMPHW